MEFRKFFILVAILVVSTVVLGQPRKVDSAECGPVRIWEWNGQYHATMPDGHQSEVWMADDLHSNEIDFFIQSIPTHFYLRIWTNKPTAGGYQSWLKYYDTEKSVVCNVSFGGSDSRDEKE